tara:strand:+ start:1205 stop:1453 length:249 start_codon:yes stop_codon:yes gene_type:complete
MILLNITNASEMVRAKAGKLFEKMTPGQIDQELVEAQIISSMVDHLKEEGLQGDISILKGLQVNGDQLITKSSFSIKETKTF